MPLTATLTHLKLDTEYIAKCVPNTNLEIAMYIFSYCVDIDTPRDIMTPAEHHSLKEILKDA